MFLKNKFLLKFLLFIFLICFFPKNVSALSSGGISAYPANPNPNDIRTKSWFIYNLDLNESKEDFLIVRNDLDKEQKIKLYPVDAMANNIGGFALEKESDTRDGIGAWVKLSENEITLKPKETKKVKFIIQIPAQASVGEHAGAIIVQKGLTEEQKSIKGGFVITTRIGIRIYETVPGDIIKKLELGKISYKYDKNKNKYIANAQIKNNGNITIDPKIRLALKDVFFKKQSKTITQNIQVPRGSEVVARFEFNKPKIGKFKTDIDLMYENEKGEIKTLKNKKSFIFWAIPWEWLLVIILLLLANFLFFLFDFLIKKQEKKYYRLYEVEKGDDLESIADALKINWKKIAKLNKLKPPYKLEPGQEIILIDKNNIMTIEEEEEKEEENYIENKQEYQKYEDDYNNINGNDKDIIDNIFSEIEKEIEENPIIEEEEIKKRKRKKAKKTTSKKTKRTKQSKKTTSKKTKRTTSKKARKTKK